MVKVCRRHVEKEPRSVLRVPRDLSLQGLVEFNNKSIWTLSAAEKLFVCLMFASLSELDEVLFKMFISSWFKFGRSYASINIYISFRFLNLPGEKFLTPALMILWISFLFVLICLFISNLIDLCFLSSITLLVSFAKSLTILFFLSKNQFLFHWFFVLYFCHFNFINYYLCFICYHLQTWGLAFFPRSWGTSLEYLLWSEFLM